ncbi:SpoIID/LytB domain-containing protein [Pseudalkalibacillus sp. Hm43]|uniref:SpoIID/LytB domain-containing protein n=1 Tax=Pseudalkalibacillus sp. Hm43 TaxID=3450742 RepID=UPI003F4416BE
MRALLTILLACIMAIVPFSSSALAFSKDINVRLVNYIGNQVDVHFNVVGSYQVENSSVKLVPGERYSVAALGSKVTLFNSGKKLMEASEIVLKPTIKGSIDSQVLLENMEYIGAVKFINENGYVRPINTVDLVSYLKGVVPSEMPQSWGYYSGMEALKAQAVAARTYVLRRNATTIDDGQSHQVYRGYDWWLSTSDAVMETQGKVLKYGNEYVNALYSSSNGGSTLTNKNSWGTTNLPYFDTKKDPYDAKISPYSDWSFTLNKEQIDTSKLDLSKPDSWWDDTYEVDRSITDSIISRLQSKGTISKYNEIKVVRFNSMSFDSPPSNANDVLNGTFTFEYFVKTPTDYVMEDGKIKTYKKTIEDTSYNIRFMIGTSTMRSPVIKNVEQVNGEFIVKGSGFGHGIGMSQYGAYQMSKDGKHYNEILDFYYPGTKLVREINKEDYFSRLKGQDRYGTSVAISQHAWENKSEAVVLGRGDLSIDSLTGSVLAKKYDSPLLLTYTNKIPDNVRDEIQRLSPKKIFLLGGTSAISDKVKAELEKAYPNAQVNRISGTDRFATAIEVAEQINNTTEVILTTGDESSPDALSIASHAASNQIPILYTNPNNLPEDVETFLKNNKVNKVTIIGGKSRISTNLEKYIDSIVNQVERVSGPDRYATSIEIAEKMNYRVSQLFFAQGNVFIDALPASAYAAAVDAPVILTYKDQVPAPVQNYLKTFNNVPDTYILGGPGAVSDQVVSEVESLILN